MSVEAGRARFAIMDAVTQAVLKTATVTKAVAAAIGSFGTGLITAASDGGIVQNEWWVILGGTLVATAAVWGFPNRQV